LHRCARIGLSTHQGKQRSRRKSLEPAWNSSFSPLKPYKGLLIVLQDVEGGGLGETQRCGEVARIEPCRLVRIGDAAAPRFGIKPFSLAIDNEADLERRLSDLAREPNSGLIVLIDAFTYVHRDFIIDQAARHRIPAIYTVSFFAEAGGLASYGVDLAAQFGQAATYVDRILKGARPADLPVQQPTKFKLLINIKTAKGLGITVPQSLLVTADEVME